MPLSGTSIIGAKGLSSGYQPILACVFQFADGSYLRVATHPLNSSEGGTAPSISGFPHTGQDFSGRIEDQDLDAIQSISEHGIDHTASVVLHLIDPDKVIYQNYEATKGFKGATVTAYLFFYDVDTGDFSSDYETKFVGVCNSPTTEASRMTVNATSKTNLQKVQLPPVRNQRQCPWINPRTTEQRALADNEDGDYYECGETRDLTTAPPCSNTKETCTQPNRFRGITFAPPDRWQSRGYLDGKTIEGANSPNDSKYGESTPMVYGTTWIEPPIMNVIGDANSTRMEVMLCIGNLGGVGTTNPGRILKVVVNDVEVPFVAYSPDKPIFRWEWVSTGARDGAVNADAGYDSKGDPYGSTAVIEIVVYRKLAQSETLPRVRVLTGGPDIRVYTDASTYTKTESSNPVWVLLDVLTWANIKYADVDLASFVAVAAKCSATINYKDFNNVTQSHERFDCSLSVRQRRSATEVVRGLLRSMNCNLIEYQGKYRLQMRSTLAEQQPATVSGSNYNTAISSKSITGSTVNGYVAFSFTEADYVQNNEGAAEFRITGRPISDSPNRVTCQIQDKHNSYVTDAYQLTESDDILRAQQEVGASIDVLGINSYDHASRISKTFLAEIHRGNPRGDTGGTEVYEFLTSVKAVHLRVGQIVRVSNAHYGITNQLARIIQYQPSKNAETIRIRASYHDDNWYVDTYGQERSPAPTGAGSDAKSRPPFPWQPNVEAPPASDAMFDSTEKTFAVEQSYTADAGGNSVAKIAIRGKCPVTAMSSLKPPAVSLQMSSGSGGALAGGGWSYWAVVCGVDGDGKLTAPSKVSSATIVPSGSSYTLILDIQQWASSTAGYWAFLARDSSMRFAFQVSGGTTPSSITFDDYDAASYGPPDTEARKLVIRSKVVHMSGVWTLRCASVGTNTLTFADVSWTTNEWANYTVSLVAKDAPGEQAIFNATVTSNTSDTLTLAINPSGTVLSGDVIAMRSRPSVSGSVITDSKLSLGTDELAGKELWVISGPGRGYRYLVASNTGTTITIEGEFDQAITVDSRYVVVSPNWVKQSDEYDLTGNADPSQETTLTLEFPNYNGQSILLAGFVIGDGKESLDNLSPLREVYLTGVTGIAPGTDPPGKIRNLAVGTIDVDADPGFALIPLTWDPPLTPAGFDHINFWVSADGIEPFLVSPLAHPVGSAGSGSGTLRLPRPTGATDWDNTIIWGASGSAVYQNPLVTATGSEQTPNINIGTITAYVNPDAVPDAPNVSSVSATIEYLDVDGVTIGSSVNTPIRWRIAAATISYGATRPDHISVDIVTYDSGSAVAQTGVLRDYIDVPGSGTTALDPTDWWELPYYGETFKLQVRAFNSVGRPTDPPVLSSSLGVAAGSFYPHSPNVTSISATIEYKQPDGTIQSSAGSPVAWRIASYTIVFPASRASIGYFEVHVETGNSGFSTILQSGLIQEFGVVPGSGNYTGDPQEFWQLPLAGEHFRLLCRTFTKDGIPTTPAIYSSDLSVAAATAANNVTEVTASVVNNGELWGVTGAVTLPGDFSRIETIDVYIRGPITSGSQEKRLIATYTNVKAQVSIANYAQGGDWVRPIADEGESGETFDVVAIATDIYGRELTPVASSTFNVVPYAFVGFTGTSLTPDYSIGAGNVRLVGTTTPSSNPKCDGFVLYVSRDGGTKYESYGHVDKPLGSTAAMAVDVVVTLPVATTTLKVKVVESELGGRQQLVSDAAAVDVSVDPNQQAIQSFEGSVQVPGPFGTLNPSTAAPGKTLVYILTQNGTGGSTPTWGANVITPIPAPWPDANSITAFTFLSVNLGGGNKWMLIAERYNISDL